jgi:hypothetical protein
MLRDIKLNREEFNLMQSYDGVVSQSLTNSRFYPNVHFTTKSIGGLSPKAVRAVREEKSSFKLCLTANAKKAVREAVRAVRER